MLEIVKFREGDKVKVINGTFQGWRGLIRSVRLTPMDNVVWYQIDLDVNGNTVQSLFIGDWLEKVQPES